MGEPAEGAAPRRRARQAPSAWTFGLKAIAATVGGALLTLIIGLTQSYYTDRLQLRQRQIEQGSQFQSQLAELTGGIQTEMHDIVDLVRAADPAAAQAAVRRMETNLKDLLRRWQRESLNFRARGAQLYGNEVGNLIYDLRDESYIVDACSVAVRINDARRNQNCEARRAEEMGRLRRLWRDSRLNPDAHLLRNADWTPASFQSNARLLFSLLNRYVRCNPQLRSEAERATVPEPCRAMDQVQTIIGDRLELLAISREEISTAIMRTSSLD